MTVGDFEEKVWETDAIRLLIRAAAATEVGDYPRQNASPATQSVTEWLRTRITPNVGYEVIVLGGNGEEPHGRTLLRTLRESYTS